MAIVIIRQDSKIEEWKKALSSFAPEVPVYSYLESHPKAQITMALVWKHPKGSLLQYPNLACIASSGAGVDFIWEDEIPKNIPVTRVIDPMLSQDMSSFILALIYNHLKGLNTYKFNELQQQWKPIQQLRKTAVKVGIMGMGQLGTHTALRLYQAGFSVQGWATSEKNIAEIKTFKGKAELSSFLATSTILVCLLPLTSATKGILNEALFSMLPKGAFIINVARGGHLVDQDLLSAINSGHLSGAALDVFNQEPLEEGHPFWNHPKIHITPHIASVSDTASVVPQIIKNYNKLRVKKPLENVVSVKKEY